MHKAFTLIIIGDLKVNWKGAIKVIQPRIRLMRLYDQCSHPVYGQDAVTKSYVKLRVSVTGMTMMTATKIFTGHCITGD